MFKWQKYYYFVIITFNSLKVQFISLQVIKIITFK